MRIVTLGGGPASLYFAILMKKLDPSHEVTVIDPAVATTEQMTAAVAEGIRRGLIE